MEDPKERERALTSIYLQMVQLLKIEDLKNANQELLSQAIVMIAGALEVFFTDLFKEIFNRNPEAAAKFISSADNAKSYNRGYIHVEDLGKHEFDLRSRMGDLVLSGRGIDSIGFLQKISREVFGKTPNLNDRYLHQIFEKRHIIAHRRGIALDGRKILVDPNEIEIAMRRCMDLADDLAKLVIEFAS